MLHKHLESKLDSIRPILVEENSKTTFPDQVESQHLKQKNGRLKILLFFKRLFDYFSTLIFV